VRRMPMGFETLVGDCPRGLTGENCDQAIVQRPGQAPLSPPGLTGLPPLPPWRPRVIQVSR
jgi:hypothetical protein